MGREVFGGRVRGGKGLDRDEQETDDRMLVVDSGMKMDGQV